jgi:outer membrane protein assembly factor BamB
MSIKSIKSKIFRAAAVIVSVAAATAFSADWPCFHGADRTNKSTETGLLKQWPKDGPKLLWTATGLGEGYSSVSTSGGNVYSAGVKGGVNYVFAFDNAGKRLWEKPAGKAWEATRAFARAYAGARGTPTVSGGVVYYLSDTGLLVALDAKTGAEKWSLNIREKYGAEIPEYGYSESPLADGDRLYVAPYGSKASVLCLDKNTGKPIWEAAPIAGVSGYASHILADNGGYKQLIALTADVLYGIDSKTGKLLWTVPFKNSRDNNCADAIYSDGCVFASGGYGRGSILVKLSQKDGGVAADKVYDIKLMDNHHGGVILHNGNLYGSGHESRGWSCLDFKTGKQRWNTKGKGSLTFADDMLYLYDEDGTMTLAKAAPEAYSAVSSFAVPPGGKGAYWAHPVVSNGILYLRHADNLYAYDIKVK